MTVMTCLYTSDPQHPLLLVAFGVGGRITEGNRQGRR
jgi:hypothetical protein